MSGNGGRPRLSATTTVRKRREPPPFQKVEVSRVEARRGRMVRITVTGSALEGFDPGLPASSVRVLLPTDSKELVLPTWTGNEFLFEDGSRPTIRTLTPLRFDPDRLELDIEIVLHGHGPLSTWAEVARPGDPAAVSGPGRGYEIDPTARSFLLAGDESALPAIETLLRALSPESEVRVLIEVGQPDDRLELPAHPGASLESVTHDPGSPPGASLVAAVTSLRIDPETRVWAAGEAAAMQRIRRYLTEECDHPRSRIVVRGYWKDRSRLRNCS